MRTLLQNGIGLAVIGLAICYFAIIAPVQQMAHGAPDVRLGTLMPIMGPFFAVSGIGLIIATLISHRRGKDFSQNLLQQGGLHRWIVLIGMLSGIGLGLYTGIFYLNQKQAEYGYVQR